jgi:hypothetical protein
MFTCKIFPKVFWKLCCSDVIDCCGTTLRRIELERDECLKGCLSLIAGRVEVDKNKSMHQERGGGTPQGVP